MKQGCNKAVDFGIAPGREEVPVARLRPCVPPALPPWPLVFCEALPAALSRPMLPIWAIPTWIRLLAGERLLFTFKPVWWLLRGGDECRVGMWWDGGSLGWNRGWGWE